MKRLEKELEVILNDTNSELHRENANIDSISPGGIMGMISSSVAKIKAEELLEEEVLKAYKEHFIHIHDFDYYITGAKTCTHIRLGYLLEKGFKIGECPIRPPKTIRTALDLSAIILQTNQTIEYGGQSYANWDFDLAPYVKKSFDKHFKDLVELLPIENDKQMNLIHDKAMRLTKEEVYQACEAFVFNVNSMLSRTSAQTPFTSINFGLDTSWEGRMLIEGILKAQMAGLGDGSTPIFPILVFKYKEGINANPGDPNYDLYQLSLKCLSRRLFPNYLFMDSTFNSKGFVLEDPKTHIATQGCRTRVYSDVTTGKSQSDGRGNLSFTTINLPMVAQYAVESDVEFYDVLDKYLEVCKRQLLDRMAHQMNRKKSSFKFLYEEGSWNGVENHTGELVGKLLETGSLSIGFVGLAETLTILMGKHHGESEIAQNFGLEIIKHMRTFTDKQADIYGWNFSLLATPAESYAGKALKQFRDKYGIIENVSDREYFTNSNHVPVYYPISAKKKIEIEAPYHELCNAGHITYVELDGDTSENTSALDSIVQTMAKNNVGYGSINIPIDKCRECGCDDIIVENCPECGSEDISRIRRITGYLTSSVDKWNSAKKSEESERVKHGRR